VDRARAEAVAVTTYLASIAPDRYAVRCDEPGCPRTYEPVDRRNQRYPSTTRMAAHINGWQVRPGGGAGARTAPDLCPDHRDAP
jgi:hypothetical protein